MLVLSLSLAMAVPAFAATADNGRITIKDADNTHTYRYSKIFDYTVGGDGTSITLADPNWAEALQAAGMNQYVTVTPETTEGGSVYKVTFNAAIDTDAVLASAFAQNALKNADAATTKPAWSSMTVTGTTATAQNLSYGYYIIDTSTVGIGDDTLTDSAVMVLLTRGGPEVTITEKPDAPSIEKFVQTETKLGKAVDTSKTPDFTHPVTVGGVEAYARQITDTDVTTPSDIMFNAYLYSSPVKPDYPYGLVDASLGLSYPYLPGNEQSAFGTEANWQAGDTVWFMLKVRVPSEYVRNLTITDTLGAGFTFLTDSNIRNAQYSQNGVNTGGFFADRGRISRQEGDAIYYALDGLGPIADPSDNLGGMTVSSAAGENGTTVITISLNDKAVQEIAQNEKYVFFWYKAKVNDKVAENGSDATTNTAVLSWDGMEEGDAAAQSAMVHTYDTDISKLDGRSADKKSLIEGAQFRIFFYEDGSSTPRYLRVAAKDSIAQNTNDGRTGDAAPGYVVTDTTVSNIDPDSTIDMSSDGSIRIAGLRTGRTYYLEETKAPQKGDVEYEKLQTPVEFEIVPDANGDGSQLATAVLRINGNAAGTAQYASLSADKSAWVSGGLSIVNDVPLWALPTTGGSGTTMIYIIGAALVAAAIIMYAARRKRAAAEHAA